MNTIDEMCRKARRNVRDVIRVGVVAAHAEIEAAARRLRIARGLPPIALTGWKFYKLPAHYQCPECGGRTVFEVDEWSTVSGMPIAGGIRVMCEAEEAEFDRAMRADEDPAWQHRHWQDQGWMSLIRSVERFCASRVRVYD